jgi:hypothetical protein
MAYTIGTAANAAALKAAIESFCAANGWTVDASGTIYKGQNFVRLTAVDSYRLKIGGACSVDFATKLCPQEQSIRIPPENWPATYSLFLLQNPDQFVCVINYAVTRFQWIAFGEIVKYGNWTGGNWFGASLKAGPYGSGGYEGDNNISVGPTSAGGGGGPYFMMSGPAMFWNGGQSDSFSGAYQGLRATNMHAEIDGYIWPGSGDNSPVFPSFPNHADPLHLRSPNAWNSQVALTPFWLWLRRADSYYSTIGHVEHIRPLRITNYEPGDLITLGPDRWKVFPWFEKDPANPNGGAFKSGTLGFAVRYDGP